MLMIETPFYMNVEMQKYIIRGKLTIFLAVDSLNYRKFVIF